MSQAKVAGQTTMGQGISEVSGARMSQANVAQPLEHRATRNPELRGESGRTTVGQGISEVRHAGMSQAKVASPPQLRAYPRSKLRGCLRRRWPDHLCSGHLETENCQDV